VTRRRGLWLLGLATAALYLALILVDRKIQESGGPGIVSFELAGSTDRATEILGEWGQAGRDSARLSLWLDFPLLVAYGAFFHLAILAVRDAAHRRGWERWARPGAAMATLPIAAAACDAVEDIGLLLVLDGHADSVAPAIATAFAVAKFAMFGGALLYLLGTLAALGVARIPQRD
jgi:hypothetical protein